MSEMARAIGLAQQRRNERCHFGTTPTDVTDAEERPQLRHCAWSRKCPGKPRPALKCGDKGYFYKHAELSRGMGPEAQNVPWHPYYGTDRKSSVGF